MATDSFTGPQGGSWFDPANWSDGQPPAAGDVAVITGPVAPAPTGPSGVDATASTVAGVVIELGGAVEHGPYVSAEGASYDSTPNLIADQLGTADAPVAIVVTGAGSHETILAGTIDGSITVGATQSLELEAVLEHDVTVNGDITVTSGATLEFTGYSDDGFADDNPVVLDATTRIEGGTAIFQTEAVEGTGSLVIGDGGTAAFTHVAIRPTTLDVPVLFEATGGTLDISQNQSGAAIDGTISGFGAGDTIKLYSFGPGNAVTTTYSDGVLSVGQYGIAAQQLTFAGDYTLASFDVQFVAGALDITFAPCFAAGTPIATPEGDRPVETLVPGDTVRLADGTNAPVLWVGSRRQHDGTVIRITAGALGRDVPDRDLVVSTDHALFLDGVLVPAGLLADGRTILVEHRRTVSLHHVECDRHAILLAANAPAESYLDSGNRRQFGNCALRYDPIDAARHEPCAELVLAGARLDAIRDRLRAHPGRARAARSALAAPRG